MGVLAAFLLEWKIVHVTVVLCDNRNQGIVKVNADLGNGQDPAKNLYWGAMYGLRTFFKRDWSPVKNFAKSGSKHVLERAVFERDRIRVIADAYDGAKMKEALEEFFAACAGRGPVEDATLFCFVGHNGLMDLELPPLPDPKGDGREAVVLACKSHGYFTEPLRKLKCEPLLMTTGLMAPEAYTLDALVRTWAAGGTPDEVRASAAAAYAKYQKCSDAAARKLFTTARK